MIQHHLKILVLSCLLRFGFTTWSAESGSQSKIPGCKSFVSSGQPPTQMGALLLLPEIAHEWSTLMLQASQLKSLIVGHDHPAVITFDMALYKKAAQLLDARPNLKKQFNCVPRLAQLHTRDGCSGNHNREFWH